MGARLVEPPLADVQAAQIAEQSALPAPVLHAACDCERSLPLRPSFFDTAQMVLEGAKAVEHLALQVPIAKLASERQGLRMKGTGFLYVPVPPLQIGQISEHARFAPRVLRLEREGERRLVMRSRRRTR